MNHVLCRLDDEKASLRIYMCCMKGGIKLLVGSLRIGFLGMGWVGRLSIAALKF